MRSAVALVLLATLLSASTAAANTNTTLPMHGIVTGFGPCVIEDPCPDPATNMPLGLLAFVYLLVRNHDDVAGVQTAFDFGLNQFVFGLWDCQPNQLSATVPMPPGGPEAGTIATAFDCLQGPSTAVIGRFAMMMSVAGSCVKQVESSFPFGTHVVSCAAEVQPVDEPNRGSVCTGTDGVNACDPFTNHEPPFCDAGGRYMGETGAAIQFDGTGSSDPGGMIVAYDWEFGDGATGSGPTPQHTYAAEGTYTVWLTVTGDDGDTFSCSTEAIVDDPVPVEQASWGRIKSQFEE